MSEIIVICLYGLGSFIFGVILGIIFANRDFKKILHSSLPVISTDSNKNTVLNVGNDMLSLADADGDKDEKAPVIRPWGATL